LAHIRSRKHSVDVLPKLNPTIMALALTMPMTMPLISQAQQVQQPQQATSSVQTLPEVKVQSTAEVPYKADRVSSPKLTQPLVDTPQTISVIKKEIMQEQGAVNIMEALRNTPGITMQLGENGNTAAGDTFQMRGFAAQTSIFVDGVRDLGAVTRDTFNIEQLEVVKGPAGADIGRGASSGYINLVTKLPTKDSFNNGTVSINSANNKRLTADTNQKLGDNSAIRLNAMAQKGGVAGRDVVENNGYAFAPSVAFGLGTPTRVYFYTQHIRQNNVPDGGVPTIGLPGYYRGVTASGASATTAPQAAAITAGARVDSSNFYGSVNDYEKVNADMFTSKIEHELGAKTTLRNITRYGRASMDRVLTGIASSINGANVDNAGSGILLNDPSTWTVDRTRQRIDQINQIFTNQTNLTSEITTGAIEHSLSGGVEMMIEKQTTYGFTTATGIPAANLYNPDQNTALPTPTRSGAVTNGSTTTAALYVSDTLKLGKQWILNGGLRFERYLTETGGFTVVTTRNAASYPGYTVGQLAPDRRNKVDNLLSWKTGALYKPASNGSIYAAYSNSMTPPGSANFALSAATNGNAASPSVDPQETTNIEFGTKWDLMQKKLGLTATLYRTENDKEIIQDTVAGTYTQLGKRRVEGIELGLVGQLTTAWQVSAGLATMKTKVLSGAPTGNNAPGAATRWSPELTATLWSTYKVDSKWTVGGGTRYVSEQKRTIDPSASLATQNMPSIPSYWISDALVSYQATKNVSVQFNLYNLFDKDYIGTLNNGGARYVPGTPRSATLTANLQF